MKPRLKFSDCRKSIRKQIRPSCRKTFRPHFVLFGFVKATKLKDSSEYSEYVQIVLAKSCLPCQIYIQTKKKNLLSTPRPRYEFSATVLQSRAQSSPAPRSAVGRREQLWRHGIFIVEIVRFRFLCACLGLMKRNHHEVNFSLFQPSSVQPLYDRERRYFCQAGLKFLTREAHAQHELS